MAIVQVSAWRHPFQVGGVWLEHTYLGQGPGTGTSPPPYYFACWGLKFERTHYPTSPVVTGNIRYNCANCYRASALGIPDTAAIGIYGVNGVCHQATNCFLYSAGRPGRVTVNFSVLGYWLSLAAYGVYGTNYPWWVATVYDICSLFNPAVAGEMPKAGAEPSLTGKLRDLYASFQAQPQPPDLHQVLINESATVVRDALPGFDPSVYQDLHAEFLDKKDAAIATGDTGRTLADQLNDAAKQFQLAVADRVGPEIYKRLNGVDAGQTTFLCDPRIADVTGVPVPPFKHE